MAVKYRIEYTSVDNVEYVCDISTPTYTDSIISVEGSVVYGMTSVEDYSHPIRSKFLRMTLTATLAQTLEDLLTQPERYWRVELFRDSSKIFFGYLSGENTPNDFTRDTWEIQLDALDPIGFLEDLAYVDLAGAKYNGQEQLARIIANCLKRAFEDQSEAFNFLSYEYYNYETATTQYTDGSILKGTNTFQDEFIDVDSGESEGCLEVLTKVLNSMQMTITQINGTTWLLEHYLFSRLLVPSGYINSYDKDGNVIADLPEVPFSPIQIKTDSETSLASDILHVKENQSFYYKRGIDKIVVDNEYRYRQTLLDNPSFDGGVNGGAMPNWTLDADFAESTDQGHVKIFRYDSGISADNIAMTSDTLVQVVEGQVLKVKVSAQPNYDNAALIWNAKFVSGGGSTYRLGVGITSDFQFVTAWVLEPNPQVFNRRISVGNGETVQYESVLPPIPPVTPGTVQIEVYASEPDTSANTADFFEVYSFDMQGENANITGESRVATADIPVSLKSEKDEIYLSTNEGEVLYNQLFHEGTGDVIVRILDFIRDNNAYYALGQLYAWNRLAHYRQKKVFSGGFYNFFEPHRIIQIPDLDTTNYRVIEYEFDTYQNTGDVVLEERTPQPIDATFSVNDIYAETIEPKIE